MDPLLILESRNFRATSGNQVERVIDLGDNGISLRWRDSPTDKDAKEFGAWLLTKLPPGAEETRHFANTLQEQREAYALWKKGRP